MWKTSCKRAPISLGVERRAHTESDAGHLEEVPPHVAGEGRVPIIDDRCREAVTAYNAVERLWQRRRWYRGG